MAENQCIFKGKFHCDDKGDLMKPGPARIQTIIKFSKEYKDDIHITHAEKLSDDPSLYIVSLYCVSLYTMAGLLIQ